MATRADLTVRPAALADAEIVSSILLEAAAWLQERGIPMWRESELSPEQVRDDVSAGLFFLVSCAGEPVGTIKFQLTDPLFWPDAVDEDAASVHRFAIRRSFAGGEVSTVLLQWAADRAAAFGRRFLRLDCEAARPRLRAIYERFGFKHHSDMQVGPYFVARYEYAINV